VTGGGFVAPVWRDFMSQALKGVPVKDFPPPSQFDRP
jgi:membrane carboxypeptidase/penicillin-binding protein